MFRSTFAPGCCSTVYVPQPTIPRADPTEVLHENPPRFAACWVALLAPIALMVEPEQTAGKVLKHRVFRVARCGGTFTICRYKWLDYCNNLPIGVSWTKSQSNLPAGQPQLCAILSISSTSTIFSLGFPLDSPRLFSTASIFCQSLNVTGVIPATTSGKFLIKHGR